MKRVPAGIVSIAMIVAVAWPVTRKPWDDSFPLSPYAMFAFKRPTVLTMDYPLGITRDGGRRHLEPWIVGSGEVLQALNILKRAREKGSLPGLCATIAARIAPLDDYADVATIRIVSGTHDAVDFLVRDVVGKEVERARCEVTR